MPLPDWTRPIVKLIGASLMTVGWLVVAAHILGRTQWFRLPGKPTDPGMAFSTACCFGLTGVVFYLIARKDS